MSAATQLAGQASRMARCETHGLNYPQIFFPGVEGQPGFWVGACSDCESDEKLAQRADEMLRAHTAEIIREAQQAIGKREAEIQKRTGKSLAADVSEYRKLRRPLWEDFERNTLWNELVLAIEDRKRTEFLEGLKPQGGR